MHEVLFLFLNILTRYVSIYMYIDAILHLDPGVNNPVPYLLSANHWGSATDEAEPSSLYPKFIIYICNIIIKDFHSVNMLYMDLLDYITY